MSDVKVSKLGKTPEKSEKTMDLNLLVKFFIRIEFVRRFETIHFIGFVERGEEELIDNLGGHPKGPCLRERSMAMEKDCLHSLKRLTDKQPKIYVFDS